MNTVLCIFLTTFAWVDPPDESSARLKRLEEEIDRQRAKDTEREAVVRALQRRFDDLEKHVGRGAAADAGVDENAVRRIVKDMFDDPTISKQHLASRSLEAGYMRDNDYQGSGFFIRSLDDAFLLQLEGRLQFRYTYYNQMDKGRRDGAKDKSGANRDIRSDFQISRLLLDARGHIFRKNLTYFFQLVGSTNAGDAVSINQAVINWNVLAGNPGVPDFWRDALQFRMGQYLQNFGRWENNGNAWGKQIPTDYQQIDRPIATQFFRPDRSLAFEVNGVLGGVRDGLPDRPGARGTFQYAFAINNGIDMAGKRFGLDADNAWTPALRETDKYPGLIARGMFDLFKSRYLGEDGLDYYWFGRNQSDLEHHESLAMQVGGSYMWQRVRGQARPSDNPRLGTFYHPEPPKTGVPYDDPGSDVHRLGADVAIKYRGFSVSGELYYQFLDGLYNTDPKARNQEQDTLGFYVSSGYFVIPHTLELFGGVSGIFGNNRPRVPKGTSQAGTDGSSISESLQFTGGVNWFPFHTQKVKLSLDASYLHHPKVNVPSAGVVASGEESAWLLRAQIQFGF